MPSQSGNAAEAGCDLTRTNHPALWLITWDPTQSIATRPLVIQKDGTWYTYGLDLTKNVCEVFGATGNIRTAYTYSLYGQVSAAGNVTQPIQWSSIRSICIAWYFCHCMMLHGEIREVEKPAPAEQNKQLS